MQVSLPAAVTSPAWELAGRCPELEDCVDSLLDAASLIVESFQSGGRLYLCGNGGSHADCLHIAGELVKSYVAPRPLDRDRRERLGREPHGSLLAAELHAGLPAVALGANSSVATAITNDLSSPDLLFAQELEALGRRGDVLICLSTSGRSTNVLYAAEVARSLDMGVIAFTNCDEAANTLRTLATVSLCAPSTRTNEVQEWHSRLYHALCEVIERALFSSRPCERRDESSLANRLGK